MKAMVLREPGGPLRLEEVPIPAVGPNDALLRVRATGVGLTVVIMTAVAGRVTAFPRIPGHEVAGEVVEVGAEVRTVRIGDRVTCHFYLTCKVCRYCRSGRETLCPAFRGYVGMACDGGYAEYMAIPAVNLCPVPPEEARIGPGDHVLVVGAGGGVGIHAVQMARLSGGRVLAADLTDAKLEMARAVGADALIDARREDLAAQALGLTDGHGVDAVIDCVASRETLEAGMRALARAGRLVIIGSRPPEVFGAEPSFQVDPQLMLYRGLEIHGSRYVSLAEIAQTLELLRQRRIRAIVTREFPLEEAEEAHRLLRQNALVGRAALIQA
jgi:D-arabinose 1-dehydrogenase-like Zn-dependent alcohol dehydrogenase